MRREPTNGASRTLGGGVSMAPEPRTRGLTALGSSVSTPRQSVRAFSEPVSGTHACNLSGTADDVHSSQKRRMNFVFLRIFFQKKEGY